MKLLKPFLKTFYIFGMLGVLGFGFQINFVKADVMAAEPVPLEHTLKNPHPPKTETDKKRVAFAELAIRKLLLTHSTSTIGGLKQGKAHKVYRTPNVKLNLTKACLEDEACYKDNVEVQNYIAELEKFSGKLIKFKNAHVIPWAYKNFSNNQKPSQKAISVPKTKSKELSVAVYMPRPYLQKDEYMMHVHAKFSDGEWYHLNVIVTEDEKGVLKFRRFFLHRIPQPNLSLPDGVVC